MFRNFKNETITIKHLFSFKREGLLEILLTDAQFWSAFEPITWANSLYFKRLALLKKCMSNLSHLDDKKFDIYWIKGFAVLFERPVFVWYDGHSFLKCFQICVLWGCFEPSLWSHALFGSLCLLSPACEYSCVCYTNMPRPSVSNSFDL